MANLLKILTDVASEAGFGVGSTFIGSSNTTSKQLLAIANRIIKEIAERYPWSKLFKEGQILTVNGQESYALPGDFSHYHYSTFWDKSTQWYMCGPMSPQEYSQIKGSGFDKSIFSRFMLRGNARRLHILPVPAVDNNIILFSYAAKRYAKPQDWTTGLNINAGDFIYWLDNYYKADNSGVTGGTAPTHTTGSVSDGSVTWAYYDGVYDEFLSDTDEPIFNERIFSEGVLERFLSDKKDLKTTGKFDLEVEQEFAREIPGEKISLVNYYPGRFSYGHTNKVLFGTGF